MVNLVSFAARVSIQDLRATILLLPKSLDLIDQDPRFAAFAVLSTLLPLTTITDAPD